MLTYPNIPSPVLFNTHAATLHTRRPSPPSATWGRAIPWWQRTHLYLTKKQGRVSYARTFKVIHIFKQSASVTAHHAVSYDAWSVLSPTDSYLQQIRMKINEGRKPTKYASGNCVSQIAAVRWVQKSLRGSRVQWTQNNSELRWPLHIPMWEGGEATAHADRRHSPSLYAKLLRPDCRSSACLHC
jgi:hypothetical protein